MISRRLFLRATAALWAASAVPAVARGQASQDRLLVPPDGDAGMLHVYSAGGTLLVEFPMVAEGGKFRSQGKSTVVASGNPHRYEWAMPSGESLSGSAGIGCGDLSFDGAVILTGDAAMTGGFTYTQLNKR